VSAGKATDITRILFLPPVPSTDKTPDTTNVVY
jgi:hypothetical protein